MGAVLLRFGSSSWDRAQFRCELREVSPVDVRGVSVVLGAKGGPEGVRLLNFQGRTGRLKLRGSSSHLVYRPSPKWRELRFAPGAPAGERVVWGGETLASPDSSSAQPAGPGLVQLGLTEIHLGVQNVQISGLPLRTDLPALAFPDVARGSQIALGLRWEEDARAGGPLVGLTDKSGATGYFLELSGQDVLLRRGRQLLAVGRLARAATRGERGWLCLSQDGTEVRGRVVLGDESVSLSVSDPLPPPAWPLRPCYGSTGPALICERAEVSLRADDPAWEAEQRALVEGRELGKSPREVWRSAALTLAQVSLPEWAQERYVGPSARPARLAAARAAAKQLESVAGQLPSGPARDARARAVLAWVVAADAKEAERAAATLVRTRGNEAQARADLDSLWFDTKASPAAVDALVRGYLSIKDVETREAALRVALVIAPARKAEVLYALSLNVKHRRPRPDPRTPAGRAALEAALDLLSRARLAGFKDTVELDGIEADYLTQLGRVEDALVQWRRVCAVKNSWWAWQQRARCLQALKRPRQALEAALGCLAASGARGSSQKLVVNFLRKVDAQKCPGLVAVTLQVLAAALKRPELETQAIQLAQKAAGDPGRAGDLACYVLARAGQRPPLRGGEGPTAALARARQGDLEARAKLAASAKQSELVLTLARLDPDLDPLLR